MTQPNEFPPPDLVEHGGRVRRIVIAVLVGLVVGVGMYAFTMEIAQPDQIPHRGDRVGAYKFVLFFTGNAGVAATMIALAIQNYFARKRWHAEQTPQAKIHRER